MGAAELRKEEAGVCEAPVRRKQKSGKWNCRKVTVFSFQGAEVPNGYAALAQLVEQLTLNQWVPGSSP